MKRANELAHSWVSIVLGSLYGLLLAGCNLGGQIAPGNAPTTINELRIVGAADVLPLAYGVQMVVTQTTQLMPQIQFSSTSLDDLNSGRANVVLLGREPTEAELQNVEDHVVAYDAICFLTSSRIYSGGLQADTSWTPQRFYAKFEGLKNLSVPEVESIVTQSLKRYNFNWVWQGPYFAFERTKDPNLPADAVADGPSGLQWLSDPNDPTQPLGVWARQKTVLPLYTLTPEKFDASQIVLEKFGYTTADFTDARKRGLLDHAGIVGFFDLEEEAISYYFVRKRTQPAEVSQDQFIFRLLPASRQVAFRAIKHRYQVRAVAIGGINPMTDTQAIYDGRYLFSRKIHVLTSKSPSAPVQAYVRFLQSAEGQAAIAQASFLPLPK